jgi:hypothetical protein
MCAEQGACVRRRSWAGYTINMFEFEFPTGTTGVDGEQPNNFISAGASHLLNSCNNSVVSLRSLRQNRSRISVILSTADNGGRSSIAGIGRNGGAAVRRAGSSVADQWSIIAAPGIETPTSRTRTARPHDRRAHFVFEQRRNPVDQGARATIRSTSESGGSPSIDRPSKAAPAFDWKHLPDGDARDLPSIKVIDMSAIYRNSLLSPCGP